MFCFLRRTVTCAILVGTTALVCLIGSDYATLVQAATLQNDDWNMWDLHPVVEDGYPVVWNTTTADFAFQYSGTLTEAKTLSTTLYQTDCQTPADNPALSFQTDQSTTVEESVYYVSVNINASRIVDTPTLFRNVNTTFGEIQFCLRVDYQYHQESIHFYETLLRLTVDMTADFALVAVQVDREDADQSAADLQCRVEAYLCDAMTWNPLLPDSDTEYVFRPGATLSVCVAAAPDLASLLYLEDIWETDLDSLSHHDDIIVNFTVTDDLLSDKRCQNGTCRIRTALGTKWFDDTRLNVSGVALCAVGVPDDVENYLYPELDMEGGFLDSNNQTSASSSTTTTRHKRQLQADLDWDLARLTDFPKIDLEENTTDYNATIGDIQFRYVYSGRLSESKTMTVTLFQKDCVTPADPTSLTYAVADTARPIFGFDVFIDKVAIVESTEHYVDVAAATARLYLCARVDYNYVSNDNVMESQNFHETNVTITVDLSNNFASSNVNVDQNEADQASDDLYCSVVSYFCDDNNAPTDTPKVFPGDSVQFCVEADPNGPFELHVTEMWETDLDNPNSVHSDIITQYVPDGLTIKTCEYGVCNVKTQMTSKWFAFDPPTPNVTITGFAVCALGPAPTPSRRNHRQLVSTNTFSHNQSRTRKRERRRQLQSPPLPTAFDTFVMLDSDESSMEPGAVIGLSIGIILFCLFGCYCCCRGGGLGGWLKWYRNRKEQEENTSKVECSIVAAIP